MAVEHADRRRLRVSVVASSMFGLVVAVAVAMVARNVFVAARTPLAWTVAAATLTALFLPAVNWVSRWLPRVVAAAIVLALLGAALAVVGVRFVDDLSGGVDRLRVELPKAAAGLEERSELMREFELTQRVTEWVDQLPDQSVEATSAAQTALNFFVAGVLTLFLLLYGPRMAEAGLLQVPDAGRRTELRAFGHDALLNTRRYALGSLGGMVLLGGITYVLCRIIDVPAPTPLAVVVGLLAGLPYFGVVVGAIPVLLLSAGLNSPEQALLLVFVFLALQVLQVALWRVVQRRSLYIGPAALAVVGLIGFDLYGLGGLLFGAVLGVFVLALGDTVAGATFRSGSVGRVGREGQAEPDEPEVAAP